MDGFDVRSRQTVIAGNMFSVEVTERPVLDEVEEVAGDLLWHGASRLPGELDPSVLGLIQALTALALGLETGFSPPREVDETVRRIVNEALGDD